ncbi:MAG TPA: hypothetical protein VHM48_12635 [Candidatus Limnocylindrales bacterium]|nr:hypothetical protein [Candidatus Limnocylindrales bacterium]
MTVTRPRIVPTSGAPVATPYPLGRPARVLLGVLLIAGAIVATPSGFGLLFFLPNAAVGTLLAIRRPRNSVGWILLGLGWGFAIVTMSVDLTPAQFAAGNLDPITVGLAVIGAASGPALFLLFAVLAIVFPSGRLPGGPWRRITRLAIVGGLLTVGAGTVMPMSSVSIRGSAASVPVRNPAAVLPDLAIWQVITPDTAILPIVALMIGATISLLVRFRRASGIERQQLRWITTALAFVALAVVSGFVVTSLAPATTDSALAWLGAIVAFPCVPLAIGIAVFRYRLYEIDRIISRTISWAIVTAVLVGVFAASVFALQAVLDPFTHENTFAVAGSTLTAAALFQRVRRRIQHVVDQRFDRASYNAQRTVDTFSDALRDQVDLGTIILALSVACSRTMRPTSSLVWMRRREARPR